MNLKITAIGNSAGVILPKELLARLRVEKGDELYALETPDGIRLRKRVLDANQRRKFDKQKQAGA